MDTSLEQRFFRAVNMDADEIRAWLNTPASKSVGFTYPGASESVGRQSARKIIRILENGPRETDHAHMRKVLGYIARHSAQRPRGDVTATRWRYSLMNWGHDPLKGSYRGTRRARTRFRKARRW